MKTTAVLILDHLDDPEGLEALYRQDPEAFRESLDEAFHAARDSTALRVWRARLEYREVLPGAKYGLGLWYTLGICFVVGALVRLPAIWLGEEWYYPRFAPLWIILGITGYFLIRRPDRTLLISGVSLTLAAIVYVSLLPSYSAGNQVYYSDSIVMALIHLPLALWGYLGLVFLGEAWRDEQSRVRFVRYSGELVILTSLVGLGGMVLSGVTVVLFQLIDLEIEDWYFSNVGVFCAAAVPIAASYLYDTVFNRRTAIAPVLARVFAPLFLVMVVIYLLVTFIEGENPFIDRDSLITFNGLLLLVLSISVFSLVERKGKSNVDLIDYINLALVGVTLLIDAIALSAILFRLASYGFTPNRVTVLGANVVVLVHLVRICATYMSLVRSKVGFTAMQRVVGSYLPVYAVWAAIVAFLLPVAFAFK